MFPWYGGGSVRTTEYENEEVPVDVVMPASETMAPAPDLGMSFYTGNMFLAKYKNARFSAQHGSWNRTTPVGARVMVTFIDDEGNEHQCFMPSISIPSIFMPPSCSPCMASPIGCSIANSTSISPAFSKYKVTD